MNSSCFFYLVLFFFGRLFASHSSSYQYCNCNSAHVTCTQTVVSSSVDHDNCTILDLSGLSLDFLPQLVNLTQVQSLNISFNNITQIEDHKLTTLCSLQEIYAEGNPFDCPCDDIPISLSLWDYIADNATLRCPSTFGAEGHFTLFNYSSFCPGGSTATHWYYDCQGSRSFLMAQYNASLVDANMTIDMCVSQCDMEGHNYAELFNGTNCYCETSIFGDFTIVNRGVLGKGICNVACPGDSTEVCGGRNSLSIYQADNIPTDQPVNTNSTPSVKSTLTLRPVASLCHTSSSSSGCPTICPTVTHSHPSVSQEITTLTHTPSPVHCSSISTATTIAISIEPTLRSPGGSSDSDLTTYIGIGVGVGVLIIVITVTVIVVAVVRLSARPEHNSGNKGDSGIGNVPLASNPMYENRKIAGKSDDLQMENVLYEPADSHKKRLETKSAENPLYGSGGGKKQAGSR